MKSQIITLRAFRLVQLLTNTCFVRLLILEVDGSNILILLQNQNGRIKWVHHPYMSCYHLLQISSRFHVYVHTCFTHKSHAIILFLFSRISQSMFTLTSHFLLNRWTIRSKRAYNHWSPISIFFGNNTMTILRNVYRWLIFFHLLMDLRSNFLNLNEKLDWYIWY